MTTKTTKRGSAEKRGKAEKSRRQFTLYFNDNEIEDATYLTLTSVPSGSRRQKLLHDLLEAYEEGRVAGLQPRRRRSTPSSKPLSSPQEHALEPLIDTPTASAEKPVDVSIDDLFEGIEL